MSDSRKTKFNYKVVDCKCCASCMVVEYQHDDYMYCPIMGEHVEELRVCDAYE